LSATIDLHVLPVWQHGLYLAYSTDIDDSFSIIVSAS